MIEEPFLRVAACSYEGSLFGWNVTEHETEDEGLEMKMTYGFNCCQGSLRCVAVSKSGKLLACGGMDERIRIYDVSEGRSLGEMSNQSGALTCLQFFGDSYLLAGSEDSTVAIWRVHDSVCVHILGGHKAAILSIAIHPSGKLALTTSRDGYMKMWNLVQGRCAFTRRLKAPADKVLWHSDSVYYLLVVGMHVQVFSAADNSCVFDVMHTSRINQAVFTTSAGTSDCADDGSSDSKIRIATVCENMILYMHSLNGTQTAQLDLKGLGGRPRDLSSCTVSAAGIESIRRNEAMRQVVGAVGSCLVVATSTGVVTVLSSNAVESASALEEAQIVTTSVRVEPRLISVVAWNLAANSKGSKSETSDKEFDFFKPEGFTSDPSEDQQDPEDKEAAELPTKKSKKSKVEEPVDKPAKQGKKKQARSHVEEEDGRESVGVKRKKVSFSSVKKSKK